MIDTSNRVSMQKFFLANMAPVLTREQFAKAKALLEDMPDSMFWQMMLEATANAPSDIGLKDRTMLVQKVRSANGVTSKNSALNDVMMEALSDEESAKVWSYIAASHPSDVIKLTGEEDSQLIGLWEKGAKDVTIPSDIFFAETIPLLDCRIVVDETNGLSDGKIVSYRVVIYPDYAEQLRTAEPDTPVNVGAVVNDPIHGAYSFIPIYVLKGVDSIMFDNMGYQNLPKECIHKAEQTVSRQEVSQMAVSFLETWYGIQIALLHPTVREVFRHPRTEPDTTDSGVQRIKRKHRVKYVKVHVINSNALNAAMYGESKSYTRHSLVWYVIGHWRTCADGRKTFVKPFWKGPLRELKTTLEDRERVIVSAEGGLCNA